MAVYQVNLGYLVCFLHVFRTRTFQEMWQIFLQDRLLSKNVKALKLTQGADPNQASFLLDLLS